MQKQITVSSLETGKTTTGKAMWTVITTDGDKLTLFDDTPAQIKAPFLNKRGAVIDIEYTVNAKGFWDLSAAHFVKMVMLEPPKLTPEETKTLSVAMSYATNLVIGGKVEMADLETCATRIWRFITTMPPTTTAMPKEEV